MTNVRRSIQITIEHSRRGNRNKLKNPPAGTGGFLKIVPQVWLCADHVGRLEAFRAFQKIKFYGFALVQGAIAVLLDCGKVYEHIFPGRALDKSISLRPIEPLHSTFLSHGYYSFHQSRRIVPQNSRIRFPTTEAPLRENWLNFRLRPRCAEGITSKKEKTPQRPCAVSIRCGNCRSPTIWLDSTTPNKRNQLTGLTTGPTSGIEQKIISTIKTFRKRN